MSKVLALFGSLVIVFFGYCLIVQDMYYDKLMDARRFHWGIIEATAWSAATSRGALDTTGWHNANSMCIAKYNEVQRFKEKYVPKFIR